jgi:predicted RNA-binding protein with PIN domain
MRWLIDGYNVMHAAGRLPPTLGREGFRRARRRFLDELAAVLPPEEAEDTTIVFDASSPPGDFKIKERYRGLSVLFALGDENADARIEQLIAEHPAPKKLTVISSDHRIRKAAQRRRASVLTALDYWVRIDELKERRSRIDNPEPTLRDSAAEPRASASAADDPAFWVRTFHALDESAETRNALSPDESLLSEEEITELKRQIEREP